jgi:uncharacterized protein
MKVVRLHEPESGGCRAIAFEKGDRVVEMLAALARDEGIEAAHFTAIGAFRQAELAYFDWDGKEYRNLPVDEQVEVASLTGNISLVDGEPAVHVHCVLGRSDGSAVAGHLVEATVRPTLELFLHVHATALEKEADAETGLDLLAANEPVTP